MEITAACHSTCETLWAHRNRIGMTARRERITKGQGLHCVERELARTGEATFADEERRSKPAHCGDQRTAYPSIA